jgi:transposase
VVDRLRSRFGVTNVCIVADRGMISKEAIEALEEERGWGVEDPAVSIA